MLRQATPNDAEQIYQGIDYRIQALKHRETVTKATSEEDTNKDEIYHTEDSSNTATCDSEGNEAEHQRHTAGMFAPIYQPSISTSWEGSFKSQDQLVEK